jgi:predicted phage terminase large subunit-like protein
VAGVDRGLWAAADRLERSAAGFGEKREDPYPTPGALALALEPAQVIQTPALEMLDRELVAVAEGRTTRLMWFMPPQEGKSQRVSRWFPLWMLRRNPELRIAIASFELGMARRWGRRIRADIRQNPQLGMRVRGDTSAAHEWELADHTGGVYCAGVGGPLTGRPVDLMIIDDPVKNREEADSETYRERAKTWWSETVSTRLGEATPVVLIMTRWHDDDLAGWLIREHGADWRVINVPAEADHNPAKGQTDVLDRAPGEFMISARGRTRAGWEQRRRDLGSRGWQALCQGRPSRSEGSMLKRPWWRHYPAPLWREQPDGSMRVSDEYDQVIQSWDMAFKDTKGSDYVVGQVWARRGTHAFLLDQVRDRLDFPATCRAVEALSAKWPQATMKLIEDKANGTAVIAQLTAKVGGMVPVEPQGSKHARTAAVSPFVEAGDVRLPPAALAPWVNDFVEECAAFPTGVHDDQVDGMSQALDRLLVEGAAARAFMDALMNKTAG